MLSPEEMMVQIDKVTVNLSKQEAWDWLLDLTSLINGALDALDTEMPNEEED